MFIEKEYLDAVNTFMFSKYALTLDDTGYSLEDWIMRFGGQPAEMAVEEYAQKYDLTSYK